MTTPPPLPEHWSAAAVETYLRGTKNYSATYPPCCEWARRVPCVCWASYMCPVHGSPCHGTHD